MVVNHIVFDELINFLVCGSKRNRKSVMYFLINYCKHELLVNSFICKLIKRYSFFKVLNYITNYCN